MGAILSSPQKSMRNFISLINDEIVMLDDKGVCISSSNDKNVGRKFAIDVNSPDVVKQSMPIECPHENVDFFLVLDKKNVDKYNLNIIQKLSSMVAQKQLHELRAFKGSTDDFISRLLEEVNEDNAEAFAQEAKDYGLDLDKPYLTLAIRISGFDKKLQDLTGFDKNEEIEKWKRRIVSAINGFFTKLPVVHVFYKGDDTFLVIKEADLVDEKKMVKMLRTSFNSIFAPLRFSQDDHIIAGIGSSCQGALDVAKCLKEAILACRIAAKLHKQDGGFTFDEFGIISILADRDSDETNKFAQKILERIKNDVMLETLNTFFDCNLSVTETARKLKLHRNTVIYRLNRINELLNLNPRNLEEAISIKTALLIRQIQ